MFYKTCSRLYALLREAPEQWIVHRLAENGEETQNPVCLGIAAGAGNFLGRFVEFRSGRSSM
jgi:hypothetical protein